MRAEDGKLIYPKVRNQLLMRREDGPEAFGAFFMLGCSVVFEVVTNDELFERRAWIGRHELPERSLGLLDLSIESYVSHQLLCIATAIPSRVLASTWPLLYSQ